MVHEKANLREVKSFKVMEQEVKKPNFKLRSAGFEPIPTATKMEGDLPHQEIIRNL